MKKTTNFIILLIVIFVIIIFILLILLARNENIMDNNVSINKNNMILNNTIKNETNSNNIIENKIDTFGESYSYSEEENKSPKVKKVTDKIKFYTVSNCVQRYLNEVNEKNQSIIYNILSDEYISSNNITKENILNYTNGISKAYTFTALKMNVLECENTEVYSVYGKIVEENKTGIGTDIYFIVKISTNNLTFSITPLGNEYSSIDKIELTNDDNEIIKNENNTFSYYKITNEEVANKYFKYLKNCMLYSPEEAYKLLEPTYRTKRFGNEQNFKEYIEEDKFNITRSIISKYSKRSANSYSIIDNYGRTYTFNAIAVMQYTVELDNYTIEDATYINTYNSYENEIKAVVNVNKFINMINNKDYRHAYELLNSTFRENNYNSLEKFKSVMKDKLFDVNKISNTDYTKNSDYYIFSIKIGDYRGVSSNIVSMQIIIKLKEGTDFEMSFSFN